MVSRPNLDPALLQHLGLGVAFVVATANEALEPEVCRAWGPCWNPEAATLAVVLPLPAARSTVDNLTRTTAVAFTFTMPTCYSAYQLKGHREEFREPSAKDWQRARNQFDAFLVEAASVGVDPATYSAWFPAEAVVLVARINNAFLQTPGPKAGQAL